MPATEQALHQDSIHTPNLRTKDVAQILDLSVWTVRDLAIAGELQGWRFGKLFKFSRAAVDDFLQRKRLQRTA